MTKKSKARCDFPSTDTSGFNSVNASDESQQHNQSQAAIELQSSHQLNSHNSFLHEKHEIIRASKKSARGQGWIEQARLRKLVN